LLWLSDSNAAPSTTTALYVTSSLHVDSLQRAVMGALM
jgi:hypothetical protein